MAVFSKVSELQMVMALMAEEFRRIATNESWSDEIAKRLDRYVRERERA